MPLVTLTVGIAASGKTTWARAESKRTGAVIVSRDDIRIAQGLVHGDNEELVTKLSHGQIEIALKNGLDVIVADTNLVAKFRNQLIKFCHRLGADVEIKVFDVDFRVAVERDNIRSARVGPAVISRQFDMFKSANVKDDLLPVQTYAPYVRPADTNEEDYKPRVAVIDIDGTVADMGDRNPFHYHLAGADKPKHDVIEIVKALQDGGIYIIFVSGRDGSSYDITDRWLQEQGFTDYTLYMRKMKDSRPDWIVKNEIYDNKIIPYCDIVAVLDDRDQVVYHLRKRGITVLQVNDGRF
jgi:Predicted kinase